MVVNWEIEKKIKVIQRIAWLESFVRLGVMTDKNAEECIRTILVAKNLITYIVFQDVGKTLSFRNNLQEYLKYLFEHYLSGYWHSNALTPDTFFFTAHHYPLLVFKLYSFSIQHCKI